MYIKIEITTMINPAIEHAIIIIYDDSKDWISELEFDVAFSSVYFWAYELLTSIKV
jgi:hypothetical protein